MAEKRKFHSSQLLSSEEVKAILTQKIEEEMAKVNALPDCKVIECEYDTNKYNVLSLFSGCGGLDLGIELSGLFPVFKDKTLEIFNDEVKYKANRKKVYSISFIQMIFFLKLINHIKPILETISIWMTLILEKSNHFQNAML